MNIPKQELTNIPFRTPYYDVASCGCTKAKVLMRSYRDRCMLFMYTGEGRKNTVP